MSDAVIVSVITGIVTLLAGGGGIFFFVNARSKNKLEQDINTTAEWQTLYVEMRKENQAISSENENLKKRMDSLTKQIADLKMQVSIHQNMDIYISQLEIYAESMLALVKPFITEQAYNDLLCRRPIRYFELGFLSEDNKKGADGNGEH